MVRLLLGWHEAGLPLDVSPEQYLGLVGRLMDDIIVTRLAGGLSLRASLKAGKSFGKLAAIYAERAGFLPKRYRRRTAASAGLPRRKYVRRKATPPPGPTGAST